MHKPEPKKPKAKEEPSKNYHKEKHHEDWSSWSTYGYHNDYQNKPSNRDQSKNQENQKDRKVHENVFIENANPFLKYHRDSYMPVSQHNDKVNDTEAKHRDMMRHSYPAQYAVHEDVKENDENNIEPYMHAYEEGYRRGAESETGHLYTDDLIKQYEDKYEEADQSIEKYKNHSKEKTHAGRYFVDDDEYQRNADKYEAEKRISSKMSVMS